MIIDCILDRQDNEADMAAGFTHAQMPNGELKPLAYDAARFYRDIRGYGAIAGPIVDAMDYGDEEDVRGAICDYVINNEYNPAICDYINSRKWLNS